MKKLMLVLLSTSLLASVPAQAIFSGMGPGWTVFDEPKIHVKCCSSGDCPCGMDFVWSMWIDAVNAAAIGLDALATWAQSDKTVDAQCALCQLNASIGAELPDYCSSVEDCDIASYEAMAPTTSTESESGESGSTTPNLTPEDMDVLAPQIVVDSVEAMQTKATKGEAKFDEVRDAVEDYVFETTDSSINGSCKGSDKECAVERQNTWALVSITLAEASADKLLKNAEDMSGHFQGLLDTFNAQKTPIDMWGAMNGITLDTQKQMNDINALYARDLEMTALTGINESGTKKVQR